MEEHKIHDNFIENQRGDAILFGYYVTGENWAYNNVVVNVTGAGINIRAGHDEHPNTTIHAYNNTVYGAAAGSVVVKNDIMDRITFRFSNNLLYSTGEPYVHTRALIPRGPYNNLWYGNGPAPLWDSAAINSDPRFVDAGNRDFRLQPNSPAINRGVSHVGSVVTTDFEGVARPQGSGYDIGAFEFSPAGSWASSGLSTTRDLKDYALALAGESYRKAIELDSTQVVAYNNLAWMATERRVQLDEALGWARKAIELAPENPNLLDTLAWVHRARGELAKAVEVLEKAAAADPQQAELLYHLGVVYSEMGRDQHAAEALEAALALDADFSGVDDARRRLAAITR